MLRAAHDIGFSEQCWLYEWTGVCNLAQSVRCSCTWLEFIRSTRALVSKKA